MLGFVDYNIDYVIKFGGSLLESGHLPEIVNTISSIVSSGKRCLIVPGGGVTDNAIEAIDKIYNFHSNTHHYACARAQDQTGLMICDPVFGDSFTPCENMFEVITALDNNKTPVLLPSKIIFDVEPFKRSWDITSDSMALWFAWLVHSERVIVLTNVDGIYKDGNVGDSDYLISRISSLELEGMGSTSLDKCAAPFITRFGVECWVLNGNVPSRIADLITNRKTIGTLVYKSISHD